MVAWGTEGWGFEAHILLLVFYLYEFPLTLV